MVSKKVQLKEVAQYHTDKVLTKNLTLYNYIATTNMLPNKAGITSAESLPKNEKVNEFTTQDILISNIRPYFKKIWFSNLSGGCDADILNIRADKMKILPEYLFNLLSKDDFFDYVMVGAKGVKMPRGDKNFILEYEFQLPNLSDQKQIVDKLMPLWNKIKSNCEIINLLEEYSQLQFQKWFIDFNFPDNNGNPYKKSGGELVKVDGTLIPKQWAYIQLNDAINCIIDHRGKTPTKLKSMWSNEGIVALSALNVKNGHLVNLSKSNKVNDELYAKWMKDELTEGDILMTSEAPLGEFYLILNNEKYCLSQRLFAIRANDKIVNFSYLFQELSGSRGLKKIINKKSGSTVFGIRQEELRKVIILLPNKVIQDKYDEMIMPIFRKIRALETENLLLEETRDLLIKKLIK